MTNIKISYLILENGETGRKQLLFAEFEHLLPDMEEFGEKSRGIDRKAKNHKDKQEENILFHIRYLESDLYGMDLLKCFLNKEGITIDGCEYAVEPQGNAHLIISSEQTSNIQMILPDSKSGMYVRSMIDERRNLEKHLLKTPYLKKQLEQLSTDFLKFSLVELYVHIGNLYEIRYNPFFRRISVTSMDIQCGVCVTIHRRRNIVGELWIRIADKHHDGVYVVDKIMKVNAKQRVVMVDLPCLPKCIDIFVYDIDMNLLFWQNNMTFIRSISTRVEVASVTFKVEKDVDGEKVTEKYSKYSAEGNTMSNGQKYYDGYFYKLPILKKDTKGSLDFIYFDGNKENKKQNKIDARNMVLEIINRAKEECYICDPYFAAKDFQKYIWPIRSLKVKIKILNCKEQLDSIKGRFPDIYTSLASELNYYNSALPTEKVNIRTIQGQGELHDRFIIADDEGWVVGSSFNELGNRSTTINRIPPSQVKVVKQQIEKWWNESKDINDING